MKEKRIGNGEGDDKVYMGERSYWVGFFVVEKFVIFKAFMIHTLILVNSQKF